MVVLVERFPPGGACACGRGVPILPGGGAWACGAAAAKSSKRSNSWPEPVAIAPITPITYT